MKEVFRDVETRMKHAVDHFHTELKHLRTGLSWADSFRPDALAWFDRQMEAIADFDVTVTFCFTPEHRGIEPHHTSPPQQAHEFAEFCAAMVRRYAPARSHRATLAAE